MSEPYLILHKVRGQPAFDVAELIEDGPLAELEGPYWIIPTSGHRAYPWWHKQLSIVYSDISPIPPDLPDHYPEAKASRPKVQLAALLSNLITKPLANFKRRA